MFYFLYGNSPMIEFETEKKTKEILEKSIHPKAKEAMKQLEKIFKGMGHSEY